MEDNIFQADTDDSISPCIDCQEPVCPEDFGDPCILAVDYYEKKGIQPCLKQSKCGSNQK